MPANKRFSIAKKRARENGPFAIQCRARITARS
jgi:hypothetical protein